MDFDVRAQARYVPMSAQKVRLVIDQVRGMHTDAALDSEFGFIASEDGHSTDRADNSQEQVVCRKRIFGMNCFIVCN